MQTKQAEIQTVVNFLNECKESTFGPYRTAATSIYRLKNETHLCAAVSRVGYMEQVGQGEWRWIGPQTIEPIHAVKLIEEKNKRKGGHATEARQSEAAPKIQTRKQAIPVKALALMEKAIRFGIKDAAGFVEACMEDSRI